LHAIQEESLTTSQTAKIPVEEMAKRKRNNVMGEEKGMGSFGPFSLFFRCLGTQVPTLVPRHLGMPKGPQDTFLSPLIQSDVKIV
jgi:hypothetical protein